MAGEILDKKTTPEQLPKAVAALRDRPLKAESTNGNASSGSVTRNSYETAKNGGSLHRTNQEAAMTGNDGLEDDIPF